MTDIQKKCLKLHEAYKNNLLGNQVMPEDTHPDFGNVEERLVFFTLPMALNYQRNSYKLWEAAADTFNDSSTKNAFNISLVANMTQNELRPLLQKHKLALQPNKHVNTWHRISCAVEENWGSFSRLLEEADCDFLHLQELIQTVHKKSFPYLSGPKIFHYWSYILGEYGGMKLINKDFIQIAPDTHVIQCSVRLGVITEAQAEKLSRDEISDIWRRVLDGTNLSPIDMHSPLWFWSRNDFKYQI